jgi:hypothetical protein
LNYQGHLSAGDVLTAVQNVSMLSLHGASLKLLSRDGFEPKKVSSGDGCIYSHSISTLMRLQKDFGLDQNGLQGPFLQTIMLILHEWAVNRGDLEDAKALCVALDSYVHSGLSNYDQLSIDFEMQKCLRLCRERDWEGARKTAEHLLEVCKIKGLKGHRARILVQLSSIELESNSKEVMSALSPLLEVLSLCEKYEMDGLHAVALSVLAKVFLRLHNPKRALAILKAAIPTLLQREHIWFQAEAFLTLSKCHMQLANTQSTCLKHQYLRAAELKLAKSRALFEQCQDLFRLKEIFYLQAQVFSHLDKVEKREASSKCFLDVSNHLNKRHNTPSSILGVISHPVKIKAVLERSIPV